MLCSRLATRTQLNFRFPKAFRSRRKNDAPAVSGADKNQVGQAAANLRALSPPDPYKQKGVRITGERLKKKAGKAGTKTAAEELGKEKRVAAPVRRLRDKRIAGEFTFVPAGGSSAPPSVRVFVCTVRQSIFARRWLTTRRLTRSARQLARRRSRKKIKGGGNIAAAKIVGKVVAELAKEKGVEKVVFDRGGFQYQAACRLLPKRPERRA